MKLSMGIVGLPNVGKSTLFKTLTKQTVHIANYPFATIDPNVGIVTVPDERVDKLSSISKSAKKIPAVVEFYDIAGLVKGANKGEGLGNQFLAHIRECKAIVQVVRCFKSGEIIHVEGDTNPMRDIEIIETELALKDLDTVTKRLLKAEGEARGGNKDAIKLRDTLKEIKELIEKGENVSPTHDIIQANPVIVNELGILSAKPEIFLLNGTKGDLSEELFSYIEKTNSEYVIADLSSEEAIPDLIKKAYSLLGLISFFTTGEDETRAWTIERGSKAPQAAGTIHTDFENKFIRAEVVSYQKLVEAGGWNQAKQKGWMRLEGKDYIVQDGDVLVIRHG